LVARFTPQEITAGLSTFIAAQLKAPAQVVGLIQFSGGLSWLTYRFELITDAAGFGGGRRHVLRLGHPDGPLAPYSAEAEFLCLQTFAGSDVPVPNAHWFSDDSAIIGAPFLICDFVAGDAPAPWNLAATDASDQAKLDALGLDFVTYLANIHNFDWRMSPLCKFAIGVTPANATLRQIELWEDRIDRTALQPYPAITDATVWLKQKCPAAPQLSVVHGDYRLGNFLQRDGKITAVLDWELAHIGDPNEDLGWACARIFTPDKNKISGLLDRATFFENYMDMTGRRPDRTSIAYYEILTVYKIVAVNLGGMHNFYSRPGVNPKVGAIANQLSIHLRLLNKLVREAS